MVNVDKAVVAKLKREGRMFEVLVDCESALAFKAGKSVGFNDVIADDKIFIDSKKGLIASSASLQACFGTNDEEEIAKIIIKEGEVQLTSEYRAKLMEQKRKRILNYIHRNGIDPKTGLPHPLQRIELALEEAKVKINENQPDDKQVQEILKKLKSIIPITFALKEMSIRVPSETASKSYGNLQNSLAAFGKILKHEWLSDGSWLVDIEIPAGMQNDLIDKVNGLTHGTAEIKILGTK